MSELRMLLVEDDEIDRMAFERHVKSQDLPYDYLTADSIARAKELLGSESFDVILLDYNLGDGTALDIIELEPEAPIVIITGSDQIDLAVAAMKAGAYDYLVKDLERNYFQVLPFAVDGAIRAKKAEDEFRVLSHAVMSAADSIFITDLDGNVTFINGSVTGTYGYEEPDIVGKNISVIGETGGEGEIFHLRKDGSEFPVSVARSLVQDDAGRSIAYVLMVRDITEQKRAEEQLKRINEELQGYAHTVSHDLKGPFTGMLLGISAVRRLMDDQGVSGQDIESSLDVIKNSALKSVALIDDLLELAEAGQQPAEVEEVDVSSVVERIVQENAAEIEARGAEVRASGPLGKVRASPAHVYQLFANLIRNCVKHCKSEHPVIEVTLSGEGEAAGHRYLVRDNGEGIPAEDISEIFKPFFKGSGGGTGIGLATVKKIVELYGGSIRACNDDGACFEFALKDYDGGLTGSNE